MGEIMKQQMIEACWPWAALAVAAMVVARVLVWLCGARLQPARLKKIHRCESGSVQSLSFVLVLPFFVMIMMLIVQAGQLMIGNIVMQYAAFAAARSASVWIPAAVPNEPPNLISSRRPLSASPSATGGIVSFDSFDETGWQFEISPEGDKFSKIQQAAVLACMPLGPSGDLGYQTDNVTATSIAALTKLYVGLDPDSVSNGRINSRISNKLAYSAQNTRVDVTFWHRFRAGGSRDRASLSSGGDPAYRPVQLSETERDPPLDAHEPIYQRGILIGTAPIFEPNEVGWQDQITATVTYNLPLLPGPMRFFVPGERSISSFDREIINGVTADDATQDQTGNVFVWPITGVASLVNEGMKPIASFLQEEF